jgi:hypothetical protein
LDNGINRYLRISASNPTPLIEPRHSCLKDWSPRKTEPRRHPHEVGQRVRFHLAHDVPTVGFHRDLADTQFPAYMFVRQAGDYQRRHLPFAMTQ